MNFDNPIDKFRRLIANNIPAVGQEVKASLIGSSTAAIGMGSVMSEPAAVVAGFAGLLVSACLPVQR